MSILVGMTIGSARAKLKRKMLRRKFRRRLNRYASSVNGPTGLPLRNNVSWKPCHSVLKSWKQNNINYIKLWVTPCSFKRGKRRSQMSRLGYHPWNVNWLKPINDGGLWKDYRMPELFDLER